MHEDPAKNIISNYKDTFYKELNNIIIDASNYEKIEKLTDLCVVKKKIKKYEETFLFYPLDMIENNDHKIHHNVKTPVIKNNSIIGYIDEALHNYIYTDEILITQSGNIYYIKANQYYALTEEAISIVSNDICLIYIYNVLKNINFNYADIENIFIPVKNERICMDMINYYNDNMKILQTLKYMKIPDEILTETKFKNKELIKNVKFDIYM
jgi:hypothetical protein